jgi:hypothetical protein
MTIIDRYPGGLSDKAVDLDALEAAIAAKASEGPMTYLADPMRAVERTEADEAKAEAKRETIDQAKARVALMASRVDMAEAALLRGFNIARAAHGLTAADFDVADLHAMRGVIAIAGSLAARAGA